MPHFLTFRTLFLYAMPTLLFFLIPGAVLLAAGCSATIAGGLDEADANRMVVALDHFKIDAEKEADPSSEGHFRVVVPRSETTHALSALASDGLPRTRPAGVLDVVGKTGLVPSPAAEHAQFVAAIAGDLERTLLGLSGVVSARVHLNIPTPKPFQDSPSHATASVLVEHVGSNPPLGVDAIARLIAGGVADLSPNDVAVIASPRAPLSTLADASGDPASAARWVHTSRRGLLILVGALIALATALGAISIVLYGQLTRVRASGRVGSS